MAGSRKAGRVRSASRRPPRSLFRRVLSTTLRLGVLFSIAFAATFAALGWPRWVKARDAAVAMARAHQQHELAHPGWSFPGRVWSAPAPLDLPKARRIAHAEARDYTPACPPRAPGEFCEKTGEVVPRGGVFPEGPQPPGTEGWTRPLAMEPLLIGQLIGPDAEIRAHLPLHEAPDHLIAALMAAEDTDYYDHFGVNPVGLARAFWVNISGQGMMQGASTITMQVVRNLSQDKERTLRRKIREMVAAVALDRELGKEQVLQFYLDAPYLGQFGSFSICGFKAAARHYYGVEPEALSLGQAATLASILPAPGRFAPDRSPALARERRDRTLQKMRELGWPGDEIDRALAEPVATVTPTLPEDRYPAYLQATRQWLESDLPVGVIYGSGLEVHTALDVVVQETSDDLIPTRLRFLEGAVGRRSDDPLEAAGAIVSPDTGFLVAAYGGTQALATDFNRATQARRQAGSSIKPLVYAMAFAERDAEGQRVWRAHDTVRNDHRVFPNTDGWRPRNVGWKYSNTSTLAMGLAWSQNVATASLLEELGGPVPFKQWATKLGYDTSHWRDEMGLALGTGEVTPLEMARFVATVVADGRLASGRPVVQAVDAGGHTRVSPLEERPAVMTPEDAALTRGIMQLVITYGTGGASRGAAGRPGYNGPAIGKTGTTDSEKDVWFVGGTPQYAAALWIGYDQPRRIGGSASDLAAPLWGWWMRAAHEGLPVREFEGVKIRGRGVCTQTGKYSNGSCRLIGAPFLEGDKPAGACTIAHPPPDPEAKKYEGLWKRKAREAEEKAAAEAEASGAPAPE